jgi:hypothetical protein
LRKKKQVLLEIKKTKKKLQVLQDIMTTKHQTETLYEAERERVRALETQNTHLLAQLHAAQSCPEVSHTGGPQSSQTRTRERTMSPGISHSGAPQGSKVPGEHASREREADVEAKFVGEFVETREEKTVGTQEEETVGANVEAKFMGEFVGTLSLPPTLSLSLPPSLPLSSSEPSGGKFVGKYREGSEEERGREGGRERDRERDRERGEGGEGGGAGKRDSVEQAEEEGREGVLSLLSKETYYGIKRDLLQCQKRPEEEGQEGVLSRLGGEREESGNVREEREEEEVERDKVMRFLEREVEREHVLRTALDRALRYI